MNRLLYDSLGGPSGAGGGGEKEREIPQSYKNWATAYADTIADDSPKSFRDHLGAELYNAMCVAYRHLSPSPFPPIPHDIVSFWDEVLKKPIPCPDEGRYFEWCYWMLKNEHPVHQIQLENEVDKVVYTVGNKTENGEIKSLHWLGNYWSYRNEKGDGISINGPIKGDDYHRDRFQRKADESPSLPGEQDPESVCPICDGRGRVSYYTGEDGGKEKGEQVEGKVTANSFRVADEENMTGIEKGLLYAQGMVDHSPKDREYWKGYLDAMVVAKEWIDELTEPPSVEADQQVPEEFYKWVDMWIYSTIGSGRGKEFDDKKRLAEQIAVAAAHYFISGEIATIKESFKSSTYQHDQDLEIVKGERDELCDLLNILNEGYSDHFTKFLNDRIYKALNRFTNNSNGE